MRILIIPSWYPTASKPMNGIFVREQADALSLEHDVRVLYLDVLPRGTRAKPKRVVMRDRGYIEEIIEVPNRRFLWQFVYLLTMARGLSRMKRSFKPDLIHCHVAVPAAWSAITMRSLLRVPIVLTEHTSEFDSWTRRPGLRWMARKAFSGADAVIAVGEGQRRRIRQAFHRERNLVVVPNIVDTNAFRPSELPSVDEGYRLLFVGLMDTNQKGVGILLEALARIMTEGRLDRPLRLDLVGDGARRSKYEEQSKKLGLQQAVRFQGLQPHHAIARLMSQCHALVLPSLHEAAPLVIIEALASGRPVISTRCGGPEFMLDDTTGVVVEPGQPGALASAIAHALTHLKIYNPQTIASVAEEVYSHAAVMTALDTIYDRVCSTWKS